MFAFDFKQLNKIFYFRVKLNVNKTYIFHLLS